MKLTFLGTRGGIIARSHEHYKHSSLLVQYYNKSIIIDWGADWLGQLNKYKPDAIFITHAHPDHVGGLQNGAACPVYASKDTWDRISYPITQKNIISDQKPVSIGKILIESFEVEHSLNAPAVGYRITAGASSIFYVPDLIAIKKQHAALQGVKLYIGDGAIITRTMLMRKRDSVIIGHVPIKHQVAWCVEEQVPWMIITHCGSEIVKGDKNRIAQKIETLAKEYKIKVTIAHDGLALTLR